MDKSQNDLSSKLKIDQQIMAQKNKHNINQYPIRRLFFENSLAKRQ
jgi:hypothetical protein